METFLQITYLNDFVFCPYSIYLHQVFDNNAEDVYSAAPQQKGKAEHRDIDSFVDADSSLSKKQEILKGIYVISTRLGVYGKIDTLFVTQKKLIEHKYNIIKLYKGYYYQLWAQFYALTEMGYEIEQLSFYSIKEQKEFPIPLPVDSDKTELLLHIRKIARFDFESEISINPQKCRHCIYSSLCDKTETEHVYA